MNRSDANMAKHQYITSMNKRYDTIENLEYVLETKPRIQRSEIIPHQEAAGPYIQMYTSILKIGVILNSKTYNSYQRYQDYNLVHQTRVSST